MCSANDDISVMPMKRVSADLSSKKSMKNPVELREAVIFGEHSESLAEQLCKSRMCDRARFCG